MFYVYLIQSKNNPSKIYIGSTSSVKRRLSEHNMGQTFSTSKFRPWKVIYYEGYVSEKDARLREKKLKHHGKGVAELKKRLINSLDN